MKTVSFETDLHDTYWLVWPLMFKLKKNIYNLSLFCFFHSIYILLPLNFINPHVVFILCSAIFVNIKTSSFDTAPNLRR